MFFDFYRLVAALAAATVFTALPAYAGEIVLKSGDVLKGELLEIRESKVIWESPTFGPLDVIKAQIVKIESSKALKIRGISGPCYWSGLLNVDAFFECSGERRTIPFFAMKQVAAYEHHKEISRDFSGKIFLSGTQSSGNKTEESWLGDVKFTLRYTDYRHDLYYVYDIKSLEESPSLEHYSARYDFNWFFAPQTYWVWNVGQEKDDAKNVVNRTSYGTGIGYQFWESKRTSFSLESGAGQVAETIKSVPLEGEEAVDIDNEYASFRLSSRFEYLFPLDIAFYNRNFFNQSLDDSDDWKASVDTGVSLPFGFGVSADIKFLYEYQNLPPGGTQKEDKTLRVGVGYHW